MGEASADLVIIGFGAAGAAAAITAARKGARVTIVEKQAADAHYPDTAISGGIFMTVNDVERATTYLEKCADGAVPREVSRALVRGAARVPAWLEEVGADLEYRRIRGAQHMGVDGSEAIEVYATANRFGDTLTLSREAMGRGYNPLRPAGETGPDFFNALRRIVLSDARITVEWETRAERLRRTDGRIDGVECSTTAGAAVIGARFGVILATGGFAYDEDAKRNFLRVHPTHFYGSPDNTGDGLRMAQAAGSGLRNMSHFVGRGTMHFERSDGVSLNFNPKTYPSKYDYCSTAPCGFVVVDRHGRRYANEWEHAVPVLHTFQHKMFEYDPSDQAYPRVPSYWIFDARRFRADALTTVMNGVSATPLYRWSADNSKERAAGWLNEGATIREAAAKAGVDDPDACADAVQAYNEACASGIDSWGRPKNSLVSLDEPPFYCVALYPGGTSTNGGPACGVRGEVLDPFGQHIPGLYAAGDVSVPFGMLYPSSGSLITQALVFGWTAAEAALEEAP